ncbi:hypothetical protein Pmani_002278 [Petrolisthes manimaculis]|uniref:Uncharacterized protein n=1 Tax=Petrolisthes manimaculis TaxID=1843537 RepID=A0AAE1QIV0_9EUCA|nr:hypothetical protein Pmani_002278 [Petrolisthes manimaculis]
MEDEWEELDESAMEECMVLATQLYTQPQKNLLQKVNSNINHQDQLYHCLDNNDVAGHPAHEVSLYNGGGGETTVANGVVDSGVWSSRGSAVNNSTKTNGGVSTFGSYQSSVSKPIGNYSNRFSDFTVTKNSMGRGPLRGKANITQSKAYGSLTLSGPGTSIRSSPSDSSTAHHNVARPISPTSESGTIQQQLGKVEKERAVLDEKVLVMQGEISLLRAELKRKETALESERLDRCAAIDTAEKRGKEKVAKMLSETEEKSKENMMLIDKLQGELHFKKREIGELLSRCQQLEAKCGGGGGGEEFVRTTGNKRGRNELTSPFSSPSTSHTKFLSRFDFGNEAVKVSSVEVQTESTRQQTSRRRKLHVTLSKGQGCGVRRMALLLSSLSTSATTTEQPSENHGSNLPCEWSHIISQTISQSDDNGAWQRLVEVANTRLQKIYSTITETPTEATRNSEKYKDVWTWYENSIMGALEILSFGVGAIDDVVHIIRSLTLHLKPLYIKEQVVNNRIRLKILQTTRKMIETVSGPIDQSLCSDLLLLLINCCENIGSSTEVTTVLEILATLGHHSSLTRLLCAHSGKCVVGLMCSKMRSMGDSRGEMVLALLAWVMSVVRQTPPWFSSSCSCPTLLLGALTSCVYRHILSKSSDDKETEKRKLVVVAVRVVRAWSVVDPGWWERVSPLPHFPALMALIPSVTANTAIDKHTVDQLYDLYEFDDNSF